MNSNIVILGNKELIDLFAIIGIDGYEVKTASELTDKIEEIIKQKDVKVIAVSEVLACTCQRYLALKEAKQAIPIIIEIPDSIDKIEGDDEFLKSSLGLNF